MRVHTKHLRSACNNRPIVLDSAADQRSDIYRRARRFFNQGDAAAVHPSLGRVENPLFSLPLPLSLSCSYVCRKEQSVLHSLR